MNEEFLKNCAEVVTMAYVMLAIAMLLVVLIMKWWYRREDKMTECPNCHAVVGKDTVRCPRCGCCLKCEI